ncbi:uncharacterized protein ARMOST_06191 [Armillaria ostoyae]|uniref:Uncharacterized protein n=1 Tax=Armillaria ostoyae TaxID=47428 RepID=A0A284R2A5_ARMOS|nr:uncharacterized protein ARMOST_06191 [Armillaria ostoyae]
MPNEGAFQTAWADSFINPSHCCEQGGFTYVASAQQSDQSADHAGSEGSNCESKNVRTERCNRLKRSNRPGIQMNNVILAANFHTHPLSSRVEGDPQPCRADMTNAYARGLPGVVVSRDGIYSYGPERRANTRNPKGYPRPVPPPAVARLTGERRQPPPWVVRNQWPEGTGARAVDGALVENEAMTDDSSAGDPDVIYVEWSDGDIVYDEPLAESEDPIEIRSEPDE